MQEQARSTPTDAPLQAPHEERSITAPSTPDPDPPAPIGFRARGRARRRARFLRKARELAYRDLGGLVFSLHRFGQRNDPLVLSKLTLLSRIDTELRTLEASLQEPQAVSVLREAGITACPRCAAIHSSEDGFCPNCGLAVDRRVDLPAGFQAAAPAATATGGGAPSAAQLAPARAPVASAPSERAPAGAGAGSPPGSAEAPTRSVPAQQAPGEPAPAQPSIGRSPTPPASRQSPPQRTAGDRGAPTPTSPALGEQDSPTEILRPAQPPT